MTNRMKLIPIVSNPEHSFTKVSYATSTILKNYNGTPVLTRPEHRITKSEGILNIEFNAHEFAYLTRCTMHAVKDVMPEFCVDMGLTIQGEDSDLTLPENILLCVRVNYLQLLSSTDKVLSVP
jgi:hypothetical protein